MSNHMHASPQKLPIAISIPDKTSGTVIQAYLQHIYMQYFMVPLLSKPTMEKSFKMTILKGSRRTSDETLIFKSSLAQSM